MMKYLLLVALFSGCGSDSKDVRVEYEDTDTPVVVAYTWDDMKAKCFTCHNSSAPKIPLDEAGFKASPKVLSEIESGDMPKGNTAGFDKAKAVAYIKGVKEKPKDSGGGYSEY